MRTSYIDAKFFRHRRERLAALIPGAALILPAWPEQIRNADSHFNYRPESNLYYLTGFDEPEAVLVFRPGKSPETTVFVREKNVERETWDGFRFGLEGARETFGFDETRSIADFDKLAPELLRGCDKIYYSLFRNTEFDQKFGRALMAHYGWRPRFGIGLPPIEDASPVLGELRIRKTEEEQELMRQAGRITAEAHMALMRATKPGVSERALHGLFLKEIMDRGATTEAYGGIVATGDNATTLHYRYNESTLEDGQLLLVDCGAEYLFYSGDITRTWPVGGSFTPAQKRIYQKVLNVQEHLIKMVKPGVAHAELQKYTIQAMTEILLEEGLLKGAAHENIGANKHTRYYPHGVSHLLGLDTHDVGLLLSDGKPRLMEEGWCLTIEPGLYFPAHDPNVPDELKGMGIRIEDDLLITAGGNEVLTKDAPKSVEGMEALIGRG